jgi:hypothetical protein
MSAAQEAAYNYTNTYTTPAGVKVSVGDLICKPTYFSHEQKYVGVVTGIKRYGTRGRWHICYELLSDNRHTDYTRSTWAHTFAKYDYSIQHFKHEGA